MKKDCLKAIFGFIFLTGLILMSACDKEKGPNSGWLEGTISIGPICPVEKIPPDPACMPTAGLNPSLDGSFSTELPPGNYQVVLETANKYIGGSNLPAEVSIVSQEKTILSINIDTGIR
jgi:hypothetical protein